MHWPVTFQMVILATICGFSLKKQSLGFALRPVLVQRWGLPTTQYNKFCFKSGGKYLEDSFCRSCLLQQMQTLVLITLFCDCSLRLCTQFLHICAWLNLSILHRVSSTFCPKQAKAKNSQTRGLWHAFFILKLHFQSKAVVPTQLNLPLQPWTRHTIFCSKILSSFSSWHVRSFTMKRDSPLPCVDSFLEVQKITDFA